eukprot:8741607-Pyramimonas_sp.AAC.1
MEMPEEEDELMPGGGGEPMASGFGAAPGAAGYAAAGLNGPLGPPSHYVWGAQGSMHQQMPHTYMGPSPQQ